MAAKSPLSAELPADAQLFDDRAIPLGVFLAQVVEQRAALADQHQQPAPRMMILRVLLEVLGQAVHPLGQERDLDFGRARVAFVRAELLDQALLTVEGQWHRGGLLQSPRPEVTPVDGFKNSCFVDNYDSPTVPRRRREVKLRRQRRASGRNIRGDLRLEGFDARELALLA